MANNILMKNAESPSDKGGYVIPPLPQTKLLPEKDTKVRSPLGRSYKNCGRRGQDRSAFAFPEDEEGPSSSQPLNTNRGALAPLQLNSKRKAERNIANVTVEKENYLPTLPSSSHRLVPSKPSSSSSVLRPQETMEMVFGLTSQSSEEYRQLCHKIADGPLSDNAAAWRKLLEIARQEEDSSTALHKHGCLRKLHRRAIKKFPITTQKQTSDSFNVLQIWLSYTKVLGNEGAKEDCRVVFGKIRESGLAAKEGSFYLAFANFEKRNNNPQGAKQILELGLEKDAQPRQSLKSALVDLSRSSASARPQSLATATRAQDKSSSNHHLDRVTQREASRKRTADVAISPKRRRTGRGAVEGKLQRRREDEPQRKVTFPTAEGLDEASAAPLSGGARSSTREHSKLRSDIASKPRPPQNVPALRTTNERNPVHICNGNSGSQGVNSIPNNQQEPTPPRTLDPSRQARRPFKRQKSGSKIASRVGASTGETGGALKRPSLLSKAPRLRGTAQRVESGHSGALDSDSDSDDSIANTPNAGRTTATIPTMQKDPPIASAQTEGETVTTITQQDLSYIYQWKPGRSSNADAGTTSEMKLPNEDKTIDNSLAAANSLNPPRSNNRQCTQESSGTGRTGEMMPEEEKTAHRSSRAAKPPTSRPSCSRQSRQSTNTIQSDSSDSSSSTSYNNSNSNSNFSTRSSSESTEKVSNSRAALPANLNRDFLPLVKENNIVKVNNVPYVKLGVIGKGGSSKVYRALTKELSVVAIKKVKLSGLDQKAIDGYANEIALLKKLRNNPSIIQMHDSEVDNARKALFVVMEAGEADLSSILQQRTRQTGTQLGSKKTKKRLDMNFIRLTWQQMLTAVHCIHEARIIHGDLKPANFLFVRGQLKLIDFGIAKAIQSEDTTNIYRESFVGTLNYMSPEAIQDSGTGTPGAPKMKCGRASDIWSLGCILYQLTYGGTPFAELPMIPKLRAIIDDSYAISFPDTVNAAVIDVMQKCLKRKPQDRPPIVGENGLLNEHIFLNEYRKRPV